MRPRPRPKHDSAKGRVRMPAPRVHVVSCITVARMDLARPNTTSVAARVILRTGDWGSENVFFIMEELRLAVELASPKIQLNFNSS